MKKLFSLVLSAGLGLYLATLFIVGVSVRTYSDSSFFGLSINQNWKFFILFAIILGLLNFFVKPILNAITFPLRLITLGFFGFVINMLLIFAVDYMFRELFIDGLLPLVWTTLIVWGLNFIIFKFVIKED